MDRRMLSNLERHFTTFLVTIITGAILFSANYLFTDNRDKALSSSKLETLTNQVIELRADIKAMQSNYIRREEFQRQEERIRELEASMAVLQSQRSRK